MLRLLSVLRDLDRLGGVDLYDLAERYGTTTRTIRRDLEALAQAGLPLVEEASPDGKRKRWSVAFKSHLSSLSGLLDASHYLGLRVAMGQGGPARGTSSIFAALEDISVKIETVLGKSSRAQLKQIDSCFHSYEKFSYSETPPEVLWPLVGAIPQRRICRVKYKAPRSDSRETQFEVLPLRIFAHNGAAYLMCVITKYNTLAKLNLQRLIELKVLEKQGIPPKGFDPELVENAAFGIYSGARIAKYVLRFSPDVAPYIRERIWHPSQTLQNLKNGGVELAFSCAESYEVSSWAASWRDGVEVLKPQKLRKELAELGKRLVEKYRTGRAK